MVTLIGSGIGSSDGDTPCVVTTGPPTRVQAAGVFSEPFHVPVFVQTYTLLVPAVWKHWSKLPMLMLPAERFTTSNIEPCCELPPGVGVAKELHWPTAAPATRV